MNLICKLNHIKVHCLHKIELISLFKIVIYLMKIHKIFLFFLSFSVSVIFNIIKSSNVVVFLSDALKSAV